MEGAKKTSKPSPPAVETSGDAGPDHCTADALVDNQGVLEAYLRRRLRAGEDPQDYIQDVYCRVLAMNQEQRSRISDWRGFLIRTASNLMIDQFRRRTSRQVDMHVELKEELAVMDEHAFDPERTALGRDRLAEVDRALARVDDLSRRVLIAARVHGRSHADIAKEYGISSKNVGHLIERALRRLARQLASDGDD